jgi:DNA mismatch repair ATPase MutS
MAQMGSYLPAASARIGAATDLYQDRNNDDLSKANPPSWSDERDRQHFNNATASSLVILTRSAEEPRLSTA